MYGDSSPEHYEIALNLYSTLIDKALTLIDCEINGDFYASAVLIHNSLHIKRCHFSRYINVNASKIAKRLQINHAKATLLYLHGIKIKLTFQSVDSHFSRAYIYPGLKLKTITSSQAGLLSKNYKITACKTSEIGLVKIQSIEVKKNF